MPLPTPEEAAANRARLNRKPESAVIVPAPYDDLITVEGQRLAKGTPVWRYIAGRQYGGPMDAHVLGRDPNRPVEYAYRTIETAARMGWQAEACCFRDCEQPATRRLGREVFFPVCEAHYAQVQP